MAYELSGRCESSMESPIENVVLLTTHKPTRKQLKDCCELPHIIMGRLRNKCVTVVLIMNYLIVSLFYYLMEDYFRHSQKTSHIITWSITVL